MDDLAADFICEAAEALGGLQAAAARLAFDRADSAAAASEMLRRLHGLKGLCGFVDFQRAEALIHAGESLVATLSDKPASPAALTALGAMLARLGDLFAWASEHYAEPVGEDADLILALEAAASGLGDAPRGQKFALPETRPSARLAPGPAWPDMERRARAPWLGLDSLARTLGDRLGKRIELMVGGDDVRIAPAATRPLRIALIALVRNACDHGVESPTERRAAAKPTLSILRLSIHRDGDGAIIAFSDDGRGVDPGRIRAHCVATGRLDPAVAAALDDRGAQELIFSSGVTTAASVGPISGRGLGLELVRAELARLGGTVRLTSTPGRGAWFVLTLPASAIATHAARSRVAA